MTKYDRRMTNSKVVRQVTRLAAEVKLTVAPRGLVG